MVCVSDCVCVVCVCVCVCMYVCIFYYYDKHAPLLGVILHADITR